MKKSIGLLGATLLASTTLLGAGNVFAANTGQTPDPASAQTPVTADLTISQTTTAPTPSNPSDSQNPTQPDDKNPGNVSTGITGLYGIAYYPTKFAFSGQLNDNSQQQEFTATNSGKFNLGVQDKTRQNKGWTVKAQLDGSVADIPGTSLTLAGDSAVKVNDGNGTLVADPTNAVTGATNVTVNKTQNTVLTAKDQYHNSVYDYNLGAVKLVVTDPSQVAAGNYTGNVTWTLTTAP